MTTSSSPTSAAPFPTTSVKIERPNLFDNRRPEPDLQSRPEPILQRDVSDGFYFNHRPSKTRDDAVDDNDDSDEPQNRQRSYSWRGEDPPESTPRLSRRLESVMRMEFRSLSAWALGSCMLRLSFGLLIQLASYRDNGWKPTGGIDLFIIPSVLAGWILRLLPANAPGFFFGFAWLLLTVKRRFGSIPLPPVKICEALIGRITPRECSAILMVHFVGTYGIFLLLRIFLAERWSAIAFGPIDYSMQETPLFVDFCQELVANSAFVVALLVLPVLLKMNKICSGTLVILLYPVYSFGVDHAGRGSTFSPNAIFALSLLNGNILLPFSSFVRILAQLGSGVIASQVMQGYFPEDPKE